ncbi:hypothetical protein GCM10010278_87020 [Streptomyces melanogenes]|nr:hypothetical protein GCM10010278_87020 [Streptomyces melanogenes]
MRKTLATLAATGVLTLTAMTGSAVTASAATPAARASASTSVDSVASVHVVGPAFRTSLACESWVLSQGKLGVYDCEGWGGVWHAYAP